MRKIYYAISGDSPEGNSLGNKEAGSKLLDGLIDPDPFPAWLSPEELEIYATSFEKGGFRGAFNRYRALDLDHQELADYRGVPLSQPTCFIGGEKDPVRNFVPGVDAFAMAGMACTDFRGSTIIPGVGHWVQQEAPDATNAALAAFLESLVLSFAPFSPRREKSIRLCSTYRIRQGVGAAEGAPLLPA